METEDKAFELQTHLVTERCTSAEYITSAGQWLTPTHFGEF